MCISIAGNVTDYVSDDANDEHENSMQPLHCISQNDHDRQSKQSQHKQCLRLVNSQRADLVRRVKRFQSINHLLLKYIVKRIKC